MTWAGIALAALGLFVTAQVSPAAEKAAVTWHPAKPRVGDVAWVLVKDVLDWATVEGSVDGKPLTFFPYAGGQAALFGIDLETKPGAHPWRVGVVEAGREPRSAQGSVRIVRRDFHVERLTVPNTMVDLDPETERRAVAEGKQLAALYRTITPERLWRGKFTTPVGSTGTGKGFGARRIINGQPRSPHSGSDFSAPTGTPVVAVNAGKVALVGEFFFPGRLVILDHGLGLYTAYFHLDTIAVAEGERVERGQTLGTVGETGRATGPHLHFGAQVAGARVDPTTLLGLSLID
ncbi:MAG TPA: M23 family metallopeptidase [Methylomirabilota bacterium]|nr:M23 family metallopeptidase [Methylomirabilota bacterium]